MHLPERNYRYKLSQAGFINALKGTDLEHSNPDPGAGANFDIGKNGILFVTKDPSVNQVMTYKDNLYFVPLSTFKEDPTPAPQKISVPGFDGTANSATFSPDGKSAAFLQRRDRNNAYDKGCIFIIEDVDKIDHFTEVMTSTSDEVWELQPESLAFSIDARNLFMTAESCGTKRLFKIRINLPTNGATVALPTQITTKGAVSSFHVLSPTRLLVTLSTLTSSSDFAVIDITSEYQAYTLFYRHNAPSFGERAPRVSQIRFHGVGDYELHAFVVKPSDFSKEKTYPVLFWVHGGPVSSWTDAWSYRWNAALFAEQGYIIIMPNITGSIGYGQQFIEDIGGEWGGRPYKDLVGCVECVKKTMPFVDMKRAIAMGASYGGYMINWYDYFRHPLPVLTPPHPIPSQPNLTMPTPRVFTTQTPKTRPNPSI